MRGIVAIALATTGLAAGATTATAAGPEGPPARPDTLPVMFVGNNWDGTADIVDAHTFKRLARIDTIPDRQERMQEILANPVRTGYFLAIRQQVGEGNDQFTDDMFTSHDGRFVYVSRPSFADVVAIDLGTRKIVWRFPMEGQRADHMAISPDGTRLLVSDSTANKVHELDVRTGKRTGQFPSGDSPHENNYTRDGKRIFHASIGRVYTPTDRSEFGLARDTSKGERWFQIVDVNGLKILKRWDMGAKLREAGFDGMESAVRPMALAPDERKVYLQISFLHGFVEFDIPTERVTRVAQLPVSEEAKGLQREQYLLDSAHHGLAMNAAGTKLCVAGTMSDYAAIVSRATFGYKLFEHIKKPYWSTNGLDDTCWISSSGGDRAKGGRGPGGRSSPARPAGRGRPRLPARPGPAAGRARQPRSVPRRHRAAAVLPPRQLPPPRAGARAVHAALRRGAARLPAPAPYPQQGLHRARAGAPAAPGRPLAAPARDRRGREPGEPHAGLPPLRSLTAPAVKRREPSPGARTG